METAGAGVNRIGLVLRGILGLVPVGLVNWVGLVLWTGLVLREGLVEMPRGRVNVCVGVRVWARF